MGSGDRDGVRWWVTGGALLALISVIAIAVGAGTGPYTAVGSADPGLLVAWGTPVLRLVADLAGMVSVGALVFVGACTRPQCDGLLTGNAYSQVRFAGLAATVWACCALLLVPFSAADAAGASLPETVAHLPALVDALEGPKGWLLTAVLAGVVAVASRAILRWQPAAALGVVAGFALLPPLMTGHGSADSGHDLALGALVVHVPAAAVWLGVLLSVLRTLRRSTVDAGPLLARYDRVAWWAWLALAGSGLVLGAVLVPAGKLFTTAYGAVLLVKAGLVVLLGLGGRVLRRRAGTRLVRLGALEAGSLVTVTGLSAGLTHLPLPGFLDQSLSTARLLLGYDLSGPPTLARLLLDWRPDMVFAPLAVLLAARYLVAARRVPWPWQRTALWLAGCFVLLVATSSGIGRYAAAMFSVHQVAHVLISMLAPALLVLGAPLTLLRAEEQPRESWFVRVGTHPVVSLVLFAGSPFLLYFTGLFDAANRFHWAHLLIYAWFLGIGYLFCWTLIGPDPLPRPLPNVARLGVLLAAMPADIVFGALLIDTHRVIGNGAAAANMYQALALVPDLAADQRTAGVVALVLGEIALLVMLAAVLAGWQRVDAASGLGGYEDLARRVRAESPQPQAVGHDEQ